MDPAMQSLIAKLGAHSKWAKETNRSEATAKARAALLTRFEREADPDGTMDPVERAKKADNIRQAFYLKLALKSAQARRARAKADKLDAEVADAIDTELASGAA